MTRNTLQDLELRLDREVDEFHTAFYGGDAAARAEASRKMAITDAAIRAIVGVYVGETVKVGGMVDVRI